MSKERDEVPRECDEGGAGGACECRTPGKLHGQAEMRARRGRTASSLGIGNRSSTERAVKQSYMERTYGLREE